MSDDLFGDLRNKGGGSMSLDDEEEGGTAFSDFSDFDSMEDLDDDPRPMEDRPRTRRKKGKGKGFLGMTAGQRFVLVFMLLILSMIFSSACLLVTGRIVI